MNAAPLLLALASVLAVSRAQVPMANLIAVATTPVAATGECSLYPCVATEDFVYPNWDNCAEFYACRAGVLFKGSCATVLGVAGDAFFSPMQLTCSTNPKVAAPCQ